MAPLERSHAGCFAFGDDSCGSGGSARKRIGSGKMDKSKLSIVQPENKSGKSRNPHNCG